jgi:hypothetical protein
MKTTIFELHDGTVDAVEEDTHLSVCLVRQPK